MTDAQSSLFTDDEINRQARGNASVLPYLIIAFAKANGHSPEDAAAFTGEAFATGWEELRGQGAHAIARMMALNMASGGGKVRSVTGNDEHAEVRVTDYPTEEDAAFFGLSRAEAERFYFAFGPIAAYLGFQSEWRREDEEIVLTVDQERHA